MKGCKNLYKFSDALKRSIGLIALLGLLTTPAFSQQVSQGWLDIKIPNKPPETPEAIEAGKKIYMKRCAPCHGAEGAGDGAAADFLDPKPRDFTSGLYKLRTTQSGELPTDEDLFRTIAKGVPGTAMPTWGGFLKDEEIWQVLYYVKTFFPDFKDPEFDPYKYKIDMKSKVAASDEAVKKGREVFDKAKCWECHGQNARGNGEKAFELTTDWGYPILPADLTRGWMYKGGTTVEDIFMRFTTGVNGTPMPSYLDSLTDEERWHLAHYLKSVVKEVDFAQLGVVIEALRTENPIPENPEDPLWNEAPPLDIPLSGQVIVKPRWQSPSVTLITVRAMYNKDQIGFLIKWNDRTENFTHEEEEPLSDPAVLDTYEKPLDAENRYTHKFRDAVSVEFPIQISEGPQKPHFFWGSPGNTVNIWWWKADWQNDASKTSPVEELNGTGYREELKPQPQESQSVKGKGIWKEGVWQVVFIRGLITEDKTGDIQFELGKIIPIAFQVWDGASGEVGKRMSLSSWSYVFLEATTPINVYVYTLIGLIVAVAIELFAVRKVNKK